MFGGICWWCHWGWPKAIRDIYDRAEKDIDDILDTYPCEKNGWNCWEGEPICGEYALEFGPSHIVWSDENWDSAEWCLKYCDEPQFKDWNPEALEIVRRSLRELEALPEHFKLAPNGYDGQHPENFPPTLAMGEMVRK